MHLGALKQIEERTREYLKSSQDKIDFIKSILIKEEKQSQALIPEQLHLEPEG